MLLFSILKWAQYKHFAIRTSTIDIKPEGQTETTTETKNYCKPVETADDNRLSTGRADGTSEFVFVFFTTKVKLLHDATITTVGKDSLITPSSNEGSGTPSKGIRGTRVNAQLTLSHKTIKTVTVVITVLEEKLKRGAQCARLLGKQCQSSLTKLTNQNIMLRYLEKSPAMDSQTHI